MSVSQSFEQRLGSAFELWADEARVEVDPISLAAAIGGRRHIVHPGFRLARPSLPMPALAILLSIALLASALVVGSLMLHQQHRYQGLFTPAAYMSVSRDRPFVVALDDGRVLIGGGDQYSLSTPITAEVFDPKTGSYSPISGDLPEGPAPAVRLHDGRVFAISEHTLRAYVIDPDAGTSREVEQPPTTTWSGARQPGLAVLGDGRVLVTGHGPANDLPTPWQGVLMFDPNSNNVSVAGLMNVSRSYHATATLNDGRVLVAGGRSGDPTSIYATPASISDAETWDPATGLFSLVGSMPTVAGDAQAFAQPDGRVLIAHVGDTGSKFGDAPGPTALDMFDPETNTFEALPAADWPGPPTMTGLPDGRIFLTGVRAADTGGTRLPWAGIYDPRTGVTTEYAAPHAIFPRGAVLPDDSILLAGGFTDTSLGPSTDPAVPFVEIFR
jgi:hypothetical protein